MSLALKISPVTPPPAPRGSQWLTTAEAARRSGWSERSITRRCGVQWFAKGLAKQEQIDGRPQWMVRDDSDARLARVRFADDRPADLKQLTDDHRKQTLCRLAVVKEWERYTDGPQSRHRCGSGDGAFSGGAGGGVVARATCTVPETAQ